MPAAPLPPSLTPRGIDKAMILLFAKASRKKPFRKMLTKQVGLIRVIDICIKIREDGDLSEAHAMRFMKENTNIPVPRVQYAFTHKGTAYIVMNNLRGQKASQGWQHRSDKSKRQILGQLREIVGDIRSVPVPQGARVSALDGGPIHDHRLPGPASRGPYNSVKEFHQALTNGYSWDADCTGAPELEELFKYYKEADDQLVLTHGDLSGDNVLVKGDQVVGIVDWETAGWFPAYWEHATAKKARVQDPSWTDTIDRFIMPMPEEGRMDAIRRKYFGGF